MEHQVCFENAKKAALGLRAQDSHTIDQVLLCLADTLIEQIPAIINANKEDIKSLGDNYSYSDRLLLSGDRIMAIATSVRNIAMLKTPVGELIEEHIMPNGLKISRIGEPLGVVGMIYEARPNVTIDAFALCFKAKNAVILKGGSEAVHTNETIVKIIYKVLKKYAITSSVVTLLPQGRDSSFVLMNAIGYVNVLIPRGSRSLINYVRSNSKVPIIETGAGVVHLYADQYADIEKLKDIILNAKTRRPEVCNALDCLLVHQNLLPSLSEIVAPLKDKKVIVLADESAYNSISGSYPFLQDALTDHFGTEFLSLKLALKTVESLEDALAHIQKYSSGHSEAIVSEDQVAIETFLGQVDAAAVYANTSPAFTDGAEFGLGAEIGISTQKLHARGPFGLNALTSYKWIIRGNGQIRNN